MCLRSIADDAQIEFVIVEYVIHDSRRGEVRCCRCCGCQRTSNNPYRNTQWFIWLQLVHLMNTIISQLQRLLPPPKLCSESLPKNELVVAFARNKCERQKNEVEKMRQKKNMQNSAQTSLSTNLPMKSSLQLCVLCTRSETINEKRNQNSSVKSDGWGETRRRRKIVLAANALVH